MKPHKMSAPTRTSLPNDYRKRVPSANGENFERERRQLYLRQREEQREVEFLLEKQKRRMESIDKILDGALARATETVSQFTPPSSPAKNSNECADQATQTPDTIKASAKSRMRTPLRSSENIKRRLFREARPASICVSKLSPKVTDL